MVKNGKGVQFNDRLLAGRVRSIGLEHLERILDVNYEDKEFQKAVLLKIAPSLLPRLQEHSGADGEPLKLEFVNAFTSQQTGGDN